MPDLTGRTAVVTGGATLIGQGVVGALPDAGAAVVIADIDKDASAVAAAAFTAGGLPVSSVATDVTNDAALASLVVVQAAHPHLKASGRGAVVNFTSISSSVAQTRRRSRAGRVAGPMEPGDLRRGRPQSGTRRSCGLAPVDGA